jgi:hypothetical protein
VGFGRQALSQQNNDPVIQPTFILVKSLNSTNIEQLPSGHLLCDSHRGIKEHQTVPARKTSDVHREVRFSNINMLCIVKTNTM